MAGLKDTTEKREYSNLKLVYRFVDQDGVAMPDMATDVWTVWSPKGGTLPARKQQLVQAGMYRLGQANLNADPALLDLVEDGYVWLNDQNVQSLADITELYSSPKELPFRADVFGKALSKLVASLSAYNKAASKANLFTMQVGFRVSGETEANLSDDAFDAMF